jgi:hypothetical protein
MKNYTPSSNKWVWWKCKTGNKCHHWRTIINSRTGKNVRGCPFCCNKIICPCGCNSVWKSNPELRDEWDEEKNGSMKNYAPNSGKRMWWKCKTGNKCHQWQSIISNRTGKHNNGCSYCFHKSICPCGCNSLWNSNPELRYEWDEEKNGSMKNYAPNSGKRMWWKCEKKCHHWEATIANRTGKNTRGCSYCNFSKLALEMEQVLTFLKLNFKPEKTFEHCKNINKLPFDFYIEDHDTCTELHGIHHFELAYHNNTIEAFMKRINTDNKKSYSTIKAGKSFLSISYLCKYNLALILNQFLEALTHTSILARYYITKDYYLEYSDNGILENIPPVFDDTMLSVYQCYRLNIDSLTNYTTVDLTEENFCPLCSNCYIDIVKHWHTGKHIKHWRDKVSELKDVYPTLGSVTQYGQPMLIEP